MLFFNALASNGQHKPGPDSCLQGSKKEAKERELGWKEVNSFFLAWLPLKSMDGTGKAPSRNKGKLSYSLGWSPLKFSHGTPQLKK